MRTTTNIPTHDLYDKLERTIPFNFIRLKEKTHYDVSKPHRHSYYEMFFFIKGDGTHDIDFKTHAIKSNTIHFVSPGQVHIVKRGLDSNGFVILFSREFYYWGLENTGALYELPFLNNNTTKPIVELNPIESVFFRELFETIEKEFKNTNKPEDKQEILRSYLKIFLIKAQSLFDSSKKLTAPDGENMGQDIAKKFKILLEQNFLKQFKVNDYAEMLNVSAGHLSDLLKNHFGKTPSDLIQERMLLEIQRILLHSDDSIKEIANTLNFEDPSYFTRFFRKHTGQSPQDFRSTIREKYR